jgi:cation transport regulator
MPYGKVSELPDSVKNHLPAHAQQIYLEAFNDAWDEYDQPGERRGDASLEETAHKVAWTAVKKKYRKDEHSGEWEPISD